MKNKTVRGMLLVARTPDLVRVTASLGFNVKTKQPVWKASLGKLNVGIEDRYRRKYLLRTTGLVFVAKMTLC